jgi:hypothetical protein
MLGSAAQPNAAELSCNAARAVVHQQANKVHAISPHGANISRLS